MTSQVTNFQVLFACTGNTCRSPMAAQMFQQKAELRNLPVFASSSGTSAEVGEPMSSKAVEAMAQLGYVPKSHQAQRITPSLIAKSDLVLTATQDQKMTTIALNEAAKEYVYTINEFVKLIDLETVDYYSYISLQKNVGESESEFLKRRVATVAATRNALSSGINPKDVADPFGLDSGVYLETAKEIDELLQAIVNWIAK